MTADRHQAVRFDRYFEIHGTVMAQFVADRFVEEDGVDFADMGDGTIMVDGTIRCGGCLDIRVLKTLTVLDGEGACAFVQTTQFTYNVSLRNIGNVFRYCSSHATPEAPEHHPYNHKHIFDVLAGDINVAGDVEGIVEQLPGTGWPTLREVIEEARQWVHSNDQALRDKGLID